ncbi:jacalin-like lectin [Catenulispora rubra]|uniref:jacalin-like lectin n=1 Tax=Catenulispora rubra TaxID=280293 RepID=UPI0018920FAB|nr:jacalin-like lectin [Catenulispora rubra]
MRKIRTVAATLTVGVIPLGITVAGTAPAAHSAAATSGTFSLLNYNVAGLPVVHEPPTKLSMEDAATQIGQRIQPYDVVNMQEDFNYHAYIYAGDNHANRTPTSGPAGFGDGLNTVSDDSFSEFSRTKWSSCHADNGDCLTPKGFSVMRLQLAPGVYVDYYNLHTNAGTSSGDETARQNEWQQLTAFMQANSAGDAVIVAGDTNSRYTRGDDQLANFVAANGLTDSWVQLEQGGIAPPAGAPPLMCDETAITNTCEVTNKTFYRSSKQITLNATAYNNEHAKFLDSTGAMLSDMDPILTDFSWSQNSDYQQSDLFGGNGGTPFNDGAAIPAGVGTTTVTLSAGSRVDQVGLTLANGTSFTHGGTGGTPASLTLNSGEHIASVELCEGQYNGDNRLFYTKYTTDQGRTLAGGTVTSDCTTYATPSGWQLAGFYGRSGTEVDKLGLVYTRLS